MKKGMALGVAVVVAGGAWAGTAWYTGQQIEARVDAYLAQVNQGWAQEIALGTLRLERLSYSRGLFSSQARYALVLEKQGGRFAHLARKSLAADFLPEGQIEFDTRIEHGPFPLSALARGIFAPRLAAAQTTLAKTDNVAPLFALTQEVPFYSDDVLLKFDGQIDWRARLAALQYQEEQAQGDENRSDDRVKSFDFSGMDIDVQGTLSYPQTRAKVSVRTETASLDWREFRLEFSDITVVGDSAPGKFGQMVGDSTSKVGRMSFADAGQEHSMVFDNFGVRQSFGEDETTVSADVLWDWEQLTLEETELGGGQFRLALNKVDGLAFQALAEAFLPVMAQFAGVDAEDPEGILHVLEKIKTEYLPDVTAAAIKLLQAKPGVMLGADWTTAAGASKFNMALGLMAPANLEEILASGKLSRDLILQLIERIEADLTVSKPQVQAFLTTMALFDDKDLDPKEAAEQVAQQVGMVTSMAEMFQVARNEGDKLVSTFSYADGVAKLNGHEVPLGDYLPSLASMLDDEDDADEDDADDDEDWDEEDEHEHDHDDDHEHD